jgi:mannosyltransferase OCH1-like enzyme
MRLLFLLLISFPLCISAEWITIPFDIAMKKNIFSHVFEQTEKDLGVNGDVLYDFFKNLYEQNSGLRVVTESDIKIPKIIHQIWLGSPLPQSLKDLQQTWLDHHVDRGWTYFLWTDEDVAEMQLYNQEAYDGTDNYGAKADILRYEILNEYGGIYVDMDFECLRSLDDLLCYDFFTALEPLSHYVLQTANGLFGVRPGHPILKHCIENLCFKNDWNLVVSQTGPSHFNRAVYAKANHDGNKDIVFPSFYFYPLDYNEILRVNRGWTQPGIFALHWWAGSWMPQSHRHGMFNDLFKNK